MVGMLVFGGIVIVLVVSVKIVLLFKGVCVGWMVWVNLLWVVIVMCW